MNRLLKNAAKESGQLWFYGEFGQTEYGLIGADLVRDAISYYGDGTKLEIHFNTEGGDIIEAGAIYNLLKNHGGRKTGIVDMIAFSCGSWVLQACDKRVMAENALLMIHKPTASLSGDAEALRKDADLLDQLHQTLAKTYADRSGKSVDEMMEAMSRETYYTAQQALEAGLIDEISPNKTLQMCGAKRLNSYPAHVRAAIENHDAAIRQSLRLRKQQLNEALST